LIPAYPGSQRLILCIDDDEAILDYEKTFLERSGYAVMTASSARQGLELAAMHEFDAVLIDYKMPDMLGTDIAFEIKRVRPQLAVIVLSGDEVPSYTLAVADAFLHKLDLARELLPTIRRLCDRDRNTRRDGFQP
jgi:DNA-binding response OmpR family regulator